MTNQVESTIQRLEATMISFKPLTTFFKEFLPFMQSYSSDDMVEQLNELTEETSDTLEVFEAKMNSARVTAMISEEAAMLFLDDYSAAINDLVERVADFYEELKAMIANMKTA